MTEIIKDLNFETVKIDEDRYQLTAEPGKLMYNLPLSLNTVFIKTIITDNIHSFAQCTIEEAQRARKEIAAHIHSFNDDGICEECGYIQEKEPEEDEEVPEVLYD